MSKTFLEAQWRELVMANYAIDKKILQAYLPYKTELDLFENRCYVSLIGFMFLDVRIKGFKIPFHINFEEVNLRFYVRYRENDIWKRGVVFIKEIVPKTALTFIANTIYKEHYVTMPMSHSWETSEGRHAVEYKWKKGEWNSIKINTGTGTKAIAPGSEEEFITEHYWGYTKINENKTSEYGVEHPRWEVYDTLDYLINVDFGNIYGQEFKFLASEIPKSVFLAKGSAIKVNAGRFI